MSAVIEKTETPPSQVATPAKLLEMAVSQGADIDQMTKLLDLQERWEANEARKAFVTAMSAFRAEAPVLAKQSQGYGYDYSALDYITQKVNPILSKHGLSFGWVTDQGDRITVHCDVTHVQGHSQRVSLSGEPDTSGSKNDIQAIGSTVSYLSRYTLLSALGLATGGQDDDAAPAVEVITADQATELRDLIADTNSDEAKFAKVCRVESIDDLPAKSYRKAKELLASKLAKMGEK